MDEVVVPIYEVVALPFPYVAIGLDLPLGKEGLQLCMHLQTRLLLEER